MSRRARVRNALLVLMAVASLAVLVFNIILIFTWRYK
jgi:hypothetical protein